MKTTTTINNTNMSLSKAELKTLATTHDQHCVSIYIPPPTINNDINDTEGKIKLKNSLKQVHRELLAYKMEAMEIDRYLEPFQHILDDVSLWRNRLGSLVVFLNNGRLKRFLINSHLPGKTYVADHFYVLPLIPLFNESGKFLLLALSLQEVKLYAGSQQDLQAVEVDDLLPGKLEDAVGYDYHEKSFQFRTGKGGAAGAMFHGQGAGKDDKQKEIEKFFRSIDKGLAAYQSAENLPLVLACVDEYYPIFKRITKYPTLYPQHISGNVQNVDLAQLHRLAGSVLKLYFQQNKKEARAALLDLSASTKTSTAINDIIPAAIEGKIEILFLQDAKDRYGLYDKMNRTLILDEDHKLSQVSLFNMAAVHTWLNNGSVFIEKPGNMPFAGSEINALFRY